MGSRKDEITIRELDDGWEVAVIEDGVETVTPFVSEHYANNFAAGQMIRLNLQYVTREGHARMNGSAGPQLFSS